MTDQYKKIEKYAYMGIAITFVILVAISSISYQSLIQIQNDFKYIAATRDIILGLSQFLSTLKDAEMGQRGFLLTGQESYLEPYKYVEKGVQGYFKSLRIKAANNIVQKARIDACEELVRRKLSELEDLISLQQNKGPEVVKRLIVTGTGKQIMNEIQAIALEMDEDERDLLAQRSTSMALRIKLDAIVKAAAMIILLLAAFLIISRVHHFFIEYKIEAQKETEALNMKSEFVSTASHELRTPLKAIRDSIGIVLDEWAGPISDEQRKFLTISKRNVDRLANLIDDVLDFQKLKAGKADLNVCENDINDTVKEVYELMIQPAKQKGLSFAIHLNSQIPRARFDRDKIVQVLTNIVNNAIKFTEQGGITVTTNVTEDGLYVSVTDTGLGIAAKDLLRIFDRFEQASPGELKNAQGAGLGLAISKEIILLHNGNIWAESEPDRGGTICFTLPLSERKQAAEICSQKGLHNG